MAPPPTACMHDSSYISQLAAPLVRSSGTPPHHAVGGAPVLDHLGDGVYQVGLVVDVQHGPYAALGRRSMDPLQKGAVRRSVGPLLWNNDTKRINLKTSNSIDTLVVDLQLRSDHRH